MNSLRNKLHVIFLPFLLIAVTCVVGYSFLSWLLFIQLDLFTLDDEVVNFWLPFCLPWIPILVWLRPRLKALRFKKGKGRFEDLFYVIAWLAIAVPSIVGQAYLETAAGGITDLKQISRLTLTPKTKYYTVAGAFPDKANRSMQPKVAYGGRNNEYLNIGLFVACPLLDSAESAAPANIWLGTVFKLQLSSRLSDGERNARIDEFVRSSLDTYKRSDLRGFSYLERVGKSENGRGFEAAIRHNGRFQSGSSNIVLLAHQDDFTLRNGDKLAWTFGSLGIGVVLWLVLLAAAPVESAEMSRLSSGGKVSSERLFPYCAFLLPKHDGYIVTPLVVDLNILVFLGMVLAGFGVVSVSGSDLLTMGGNYRPAVENGEVWRLVTSMFVHGGLMHLAGNIFILFLVGVMLEPILGPIQFATCYILCGLGGSIASVYWHKATVSVGASGAIFGLWGVLLALSLRKKSNLSIGRKDVVKTALSILGYNLLFGLIANGIDNADHLGGLACGLFLGLLGGLFPRLLKHGRSCVSNRNTSHTD